MDGSLEPVASPPAAATALGRARLYHFLELALAHPGEEGYDHFRNKATEDEFLAILQDLPPAETPRPETEQDARMFFKGLRAGSFPEVETAHIGLFSANFPQVPCPPYGSLFTAADDTKRLEEMLAIKQFYQENGIDIAETFEDLPDHLCVELEFLQLLCFRENDAILGGDTDTAAGVRIAQAAFLDRFALPFAERLALIAAQAAPDNPYRHLLAALHGLLVHHRRDLPDGAPSPQHREDLP